MPRLPREVLVGCPHHVIQRGNRRQTTFFEPSDYAFYLDRLHEQVAANALHVWAYVLMPNHVHLLVVPQAQPTMATVIGDLHRRFTARINKREGWTGHLWQGRFRSQPLTADHVAAAVRYIERNPVDAGLVTSAGDWRWSSAAAHLSGEDPSGLLDLAALRDMLPYEARNWAAFLS